MVRVRRCLGPVVTTTSHCLRLGGSLRSSRSGSQTLCSTVASGSSVRSRRSTTRSTIFHFGSSLGDFFPLLFAIARETTSRRGGRGGQGGQLRALPSRARVHPREERERTWPPRHPP